MIRLLLLLLLWLIFLSSSRRRGSIRGMELWKKRKKCIYLIEREINYFCADTLYYADRPALFQRCFFFFFFCNTCTSAGRERAHGLWQLKIFHRDQCEILFHFFFFWLFLSVFFFWQNSTAFALYKSVFIT